MLNNISVSAAALLHTQRQMSLFGTTWKRNQGSERGWEEQMTWHRRVTQRYLLDALKVISFVFSSLRCHTWKMSKKATYAKGRSRPHLSQTHKIFVHFNFQSVTTPKVKYSLFAVQFCSSEKRSEDSCIIISFLVNSVNVMSAHGLNSPQNVYQGRGGKILRENTMYFRRFKQLVNASKINSVVIGPAFRLSAFCLRLYKARSSNFSQI